MKCYYVIQTKSSNTFNILSHKNMWDELNFNKTINNK